MIIDVRYLWNKSEVNCGLAFFDVQEVNKEHQELLFKKNTALQWDSSCICRL